MDASNPFRPTQAETYEQQLDLSAPSARLVEEGEELVDVGLSSSQASTAAPDTQPKFMESSSSSLLTGAIGPKTTTTPATSQTQYASTGTSAPPAGGIFSRLCGWASVEYYQPYFDVSSSVVLERIKAGVSPHKKDIFESTPEAAPDLYGAVWISLTLVFLVGATSNLNSLLVHTKGGKTEPWQSDFRQLTFASTMIFSYAFLVPCVIWLASLYVGVDPRPSIVRLVGIYGYSLVVFVPVSLLCIIPVAAVQWIIVLVGGALSGVVLARNLLTALKTDYQAVAIGADTEAQAPLTESADSSPRTKSSLTLIASAAFLHFVFTLMLKLFFFQGADLASKISDNTTEPPK